MKSKQRLERPETRSKSVRIAGLEDFPLEVMGLTPESIEMSGGHIMIPRELLPYIKICKMPVNLREKNTQKLQRYRLRLKHAEAKKQLEGAV